MNKKELIEAVAQKSNLQKKDVDNALDAMLEVITEQLKNDESVIFMGFGSFETKIRKARLGRNPQTNEPVEIPEIKLPTFRPGKTLKQQVSG